MGYQKYIRYERDLNKFLRHILYNKSFSKTFYLDLHIIYFYLLHFKFKGHFCGEDIYFIKESKTGYERIDIIGICEDIVKVEKKFYRVLGVDKMVLIISFIIYFVLCNFIYVILNEVLVDFNIVDCAFLAAFTYITFLVSLIIATLIAQ